MPIAQIDSQTLLQMRDKYAAFAINFLGLDPKLNKDEDVTAVLSYLGHNIREFYAEFHEEFGLDSAMYVLKILDDSSRKVRMAVLGAAQKGGKFTPNHLKDIVFVAPPKAKPEMFSLGSGAKKEEEQATG